jgi:hypothetical protein
MKTNPNPTIIISIVLIVLIGVLGAIAAPEQAATILSFTGGLVIVLVASLREQQKTHEIVNSRMDELLRASGKAERADAVIEERARVKSEE